MERAHEKRSVPLSKKGEPVAIVCCCHSQETVVAGVSVLRKVWEVAAVSVMTLSSRGRETPRGLVAARAVVPCRALRPRTSCH